MANQQHIQWLFGGCQDWNARRRNSDFSPSLSNVDLYQIFRDANKLNNNGDIPLAEFDLRGADFSESQLNTPYTTSSADLRRANLRSAEFRAAQLPNAKLDDADLSNAGLGDADLSQASLRRSVLTTARLSGTNLFGADLTNANLGLAYLESANLCFATLDNADLTTAVLTGADLSCSRPWTAKLFPPRDFASKSNKAPAARRITGIADLLRHCSELRNDAPTGREFYFRGESENGWALRPSIMRSKNGNPSLRAHEAEMLIELMLQRPEDFATAPSALSQWVLAQHHGLKTRLLDVTRNPLVSLLGACGELDDKTKKPGSDGRVHVFSVPRELIKPFTSDTVATISNMAKLSRPEQDCLLGWTLDECMERTPGASIEYLHDRVMGRLYHLIQQERPHFKERIDPRDYYCAFVVEPVQSFERIRAQSGAFLISAFHERFEQDEILAWNDDIPLYDHVILDVPSGSKESITDELALLSITRARMLPGLDEAAHAIIERNSCRPYRGVDSA